MSHSHNFSWARQAKVSGTQTLKMYRAGGGPDVYSTPTSQANALNTTTGIGSGFATSTSATVTGTLQNNTPLMALDIRQPIRTMQYIVKI